ncbi:MAG: hypothetical protein HYS12_08180 [Planctomycetes bacterium]|nr:hypothetical protein [Planctomycetota bacterium]
MERNDQPGPQPDQPAANDLIPVGVWARLAVPEHPDFVGFTYVDRQAGLDTRNCRESFTRSTPTICR